MLVAQQEACGTVETRERTNDEPCPLCGRGRKLHARVYRYLKPTEAHLAMGTATEDTPDPRWFCYCGYTEVPDGDRADEWRQP